MLQSTPESGPRAGYSGHKRKKGSKLHLAVPCPRMAGGARPDRPPSRGALRSSVPLLKRRTMPSVPMLLYHKVADVAPGSRHPAIHVDPAQFAAQLALLRHVGAHVVALPDYLAYRRGEAGLPPRPVILTFDDGYLDNYEAAFPVLERYRVPATVFLVSSLIGGTNAWDPDEPQVPLLGIRHIREMQRAGIDFQSHTRTHARLTTLAPAAARRELGESRAELEQVLGAPVRVVAYPWGAHDPTVERLTEEAGYEAGVIVRRRTNFAHTPPFALRRIGVWRETSLARLAWDLFRLRWRGD